MHLYEDDLENQTMQKHFDAYICCISDFSLRDWFAEKKIGVSEQLSVAGRQALMELLNLDEYLLDPPCDRTRKPYMPSVSGWNNGK